MSDEIFVLLQKYLTLFSHVKKKTGYPQHHHFHPESFCQGSSFKKKTTILDEDVGQGGITQMWQGLHRSLHAAGCFAEAFRLLPNIRRREGAASLQKLGKCTQKKSKMMHFLKGTGMEIHWN